MYLSRRLAALDSTALSRRSMSDLGVATRDSMAGFSLGALLGNGGAGNGLPGASFGYNGFTFDNATRDAAGVFLLSQLERLDPTIHMPLFTYTWGRDIDLRQDVTLADDLSSFTQSNIAAAGGLNPNGINWISQATNVIPGASLDIGKIAQPLHLWGFECKWTIFDLAKGERLNQPVDQQQINVMRIKYNMDVDQLVYIGDVNIPNYTGLCNRPDAGTITNVAATGAQNGATNSPLWINKTPSQTLADINSVLNAAYVASGFAFAPDQLRLPPIAFTNLASTVMSVAGTTGAISVLDFLRKYSVSTAINNRELNIQPLKWLTTAGAGGTQRMVAYTKREELIRFPLVPMNRTAPEFRSIWQGVTYYSKLGQMEVVYPNTLAYSDGF